MKATRRQLQLRYARQRFWRRQKAQFLALGLTTRGTRRIYQLHPELGGPGRSPLWRRRMRQRINRARARHVIAEQLTPLQLLHREIRATIPTLLCFEDVGRKIYS